jgi:hypothetical protein
MEISNLSIPMVEKDTHAYMDIYKIITDNPKVVTTDLLNRLLAVSGIYDLTQLNNWDSLKVKI